MPLVRAILDWLNDFAPPRLAADWDNIGLLIGDGGRNVTKALTCLTVTAEIVNEAIRNNAELLIAHHPFPFTALKKITSDTHAGRLLLSLVEARIAVISPHTAFDSAREGINHRLALRLGIEHPQPLIPDAIDPRVGVGRFGRLKTPMTLAEYCRYISARLGIAVVQSVGDVRATVEQVAVACGSAGEFWGAAQRVGCDCFVTGETRFHTNLEIAAAGMSLVLPGHYASERFAVEELARLLSAAFPDCTICSAQDECDPLTTHFFSTE